MLLAGGTLAGSAVLAFVLPTAWADPPGALPPSVEEPDGKWQPSFDYDKDGCYPTPAISADGTLNPGLDLGGDVNGNCRDAHDLDNTNSYARSKCDNGWCAYMYALYFEKDQAALGPGSAGHKHDLEHVVVWVNEDQAKYVSVSQHKGYEKKAAADIAWEDSHPKIVYHKDGVSTHAFRFASADEQPENHKGAWQRPALVSWNKFPDGIRDKLTAADFGAAKLALADERFADNLAKAKPDEVPFDPHA
ncbi:NPP1 family protein [Streptomyces armeniacus]|uniref:NPP1 family protein n=1 Tax=Streptomyces armeniacus TaxID=83291 RepID=UPI001FE59EF3|nr:NPP1 family protein [Streptomyces armeniacus]